MDSESNIEIYGEKYKVETRIEMNACITSWIAEFKSTLDKIKADTSKMLIQSV